MHGLCQELTCCTIAGERCSRCTRGQLTRANVLRRNVSGGHLQRTRSCSERSLTLATRVAAGLVVPSVASASYDQQGRGSNAPSQQFWRGACGRLAAAIEGTDGGGGGRRGICRRARRSHTVSACAAAGQAVPRSGMHGVCQELTC